jgi:hypothetical protein
LLHLNPANFSRLFKKETKVQRKFIEDIAIHCMAKGAEKKAQAADRSSATRSHILVMGLHI